jgi:Zn-dependent peptidase ImmA (M78 family)/DNA-binding XRE family transcriptional regulator
MPKKLEADITPEMLKYARKRVGLSSDEVSRKINKQLTEKILLDWENGNLKPSISQMRKISKLYKLPLAAFFLSEVPEYFNVRSIPDKRMLDININMPLSYHMNLAILWADQTREIALELLDVSDHAVPIFEESIIISKDLDSIANHIRDKIGISIDEQFQFKNSYDAFRKWKGAIEKYGILTLTFNNVSVQEARGFSIYNKILPIIAINIKDSVNAKIFTLIHEYVHLLLKTDGICDNNDIFIENNEESTCNQLAGRILIPHDSIIATIASNRYDLKDINNINLLANKYHLSKEAILTRLLLLNYISESDYLIKRDNLYKDKKSSKGLFAPYKRTITNYGYPFLNLVFTSYYQNKISLRTLSNYLSSSIENLQKIENAIFKNGN